MPATLRTDTVPRFTFTPAAPFAIEHTLAALTRFPASPVNREFLRDGVRQAWRPAPAGEPRVVTVRSVGELDRPRLRFEIDGPSDLDARTALARTLRRALALDLDPAPLERVDDPAFAPVLAALRGYHPPLFATPFEAACWTLVRQRTPRGFAVATMRRLAAALGDRLAAGDGAYLLFPEPSEVGDGARPALLAATNNTRKVDRLVGAAHAFAVADPEWLWSAPYEEAYRWLLGVPGMGPWSAEFVLQRALGRFERVPWTDTGALPAISRVYTPGLTIARGSARELAERFGRLQGLWLQYLKRYVFTLRLA